MKANNLIAAIVTISAAGAIASPAQAQGARFIFAPNIWQYEEPKTPKPAYNGPVGTVSRGSVPAKSFFGFDPGFFQKLANNTAPQSKQLSFNFWPNFQPQPQPVFKSEFGQPIQSQTATTQAMSVQPQPKAAYYPASKVIANRQVQGRLQSTPKSGNIASGSSGSFVKPVASYGNNFYVPGNTSPAASGSTSTVKTLVDGRVVNMRVH